MRSKWASGSSSGYFSFLSKGGVSAINRAYRHLPGVGTDGDRRGTAGHRLGLLAGMSVPSPLPLLQCRQSEKRVHWGSGLAKGKGSRVRDSHKRRRGHSQAGGTRWPPSGFVSQGHRTHPQKSVSSPGIPPGQSCPSWAPHRCSLDPPTLLLTDLGPADSRQWDCPSPAVA